MPHLQHLLDVILVLGVHDAIHVPLEDFDQIPGKESQELQHRSDLISPLEFCKKIITVQETAEICLKKNEDFGIIRFTVTLTTFVVVFSC